MQTKVVSESGRSRGGWILAGIFLLQTLAPSAPGQIVLPIDPPLPATASVVILHPKAGAQLAAPGPVVIEALAVDPAGDIRHVDFYANEKLIGGSDYLLRIATIPGRPIPHRLEWRDVSPGAYRLVAKAKDTLGHAVESGPVEFTVVTHSAAGVALIPRGSVWRYSNDGQDLGDRWRAPDFDDSRWLSGPGPLGYGDGDEATVTRSSGTPHPITAYFRREFEVPDDVTWNRLILHVLRDDGVVVYLNGQEIWRDNLPDGPIDFGTLAEEATDRENDYRTTTVPIRALVTGRNVLSVAVHQASPASSDLGFDLALSGITISSEPSEPAQVSVVAAWPATSEPRPEARIAPGRFVLRRTGSFASELEVRVAYAGTARPGIDYQKTPETVKIPAGQSEADLLIAALDDDEVEGTETVVVELLPDPSAGALPRYVIDPKQGRAEVTIQDADQPATATLRLTAPTPGTRFPEGETIGIEAVAIDPRGYIPRVEFYDGEERLGASEITFIVAPPDGSPIHHSFEWKGAKAGPHRLLAKARTSAGQEVVSPAVSILVGEAPPQVVLEVVTKDGEAAEPDPNGQADPGVFVIRRSGGPQEVAVTAHFRLTGEARNGVDYRRVEGEAPLKAGEDSVEVVIDPLADGRTEGPEAVVLTLIAAPCIAIFPPPPECYAIGPAESAKLIIRDGTGAPNQSPRVAITSPRQGSVFTEGTPIRVKAEATDPDGQMRKLAVHDGERLLGSGPEGTLSIDWSDASPGMHKLTALATDDRGTESRSIPVVLYVREKAERAFVRRALPPAYLPEGAFEVRLLATPPRAGHAWAVEDTPPSGWAVGDISEGGAYDAALGRVKFGPFTDARERQLSYRVTPKPDAAGPQKFEGTSSLDGVTYPVGGQDTVLPAGERHPADTTAPEKSISANELTAYAAAWKQGETWGDPPASIPLSYVTRAGFLWRSGEAYRFDPTQGAPPECWVPAGPPGPSLAATPPSTRGHAVRRPPVVWKPGRADQVVLELNPPPGTLAVAVEETVPNGWRVREVSDDGRYEPETRRIRWGLFYGETPRRLTYLASPLEDAACTGTFEGFASFDGKDVEIQGVRHAGASDESTRLRIAGSHRSANGKLRFRVEAPVDQVFVVEATSDLATWTEIDARVFTGEEIEVNDPADVAGVAQRYYRLRPVGR